MDWSNYICAGQMTLMDYWNTPKAPFKIDKPIRLIELFGGIGSQSLSLKNIGADYEACVRGNL